MIIVVRAPRGGGEWAEMMASTWCHDFEGLLFRGHGADGSWLESSMVVVRRLDEWWNGEKFCRDRRFEGRGRVFKILIC